MIWFSLLLLGLLLYFIVQYSVVYVTQTPWWVLWAILMAPAVLMVGWVSTNGTEDPIPPPLVIGSFLMSSILYVALVRLNPKRSASPPSEPQIKTMPEPQPLSLTKAEESQLQTCFPWSTYFLQKIDYKPQAIICRGQLKAQANAAYQTIRDNVRQQFGDRYLVIFQVGAQNQPFFALVPDPQRNRKAGPLTRPVLALGLLFATFITTTLAGAKLVMPELTWQSFTDLSVLRGGLPYAIAIMLILGIHESGHYLTARFYKIKATLPYFIPMPPPFSFGTFGAFIQMRSPVPNRTALFDVGLAGPLAGFVVTVPLLTWGLMHSSLTSIPAQPSLLDTDAFNPSISILFALISKAAFPVELTMAQMIDLHPVAIAGWLGLIITALNLMPVGQLDGGHIVHAMFGHRNGAIIGQVTRLLVLLLSFIQPLLLLWAIILLCLPAIDEPALNDVSELDNGRDLLGLVSLALLLLIILPLPHSLAHLLFEMG
ncbi:MAG: site-2 protease family protein [Cyanobacteria bacterium P01_A01_bin.17]